MIEAIWAFIMQPQTLGYILTFVFGGGLVAFIRVYTDHKEVDTNAKIANMKTPVEIDALQVTGYDALTRSLQADNQILRDERAYWKVEHDKMRLEVERLNKELDALEETNRILRRRLADLTESLDSAEDRSPVHQAGREDLIDPEGPHMNVFPNV